MFLHLKYPLPHSFNVFLHSGFLKHFCDLDDATKYAGINFFLQFNQPPTNDTFTRAARYPNFCLHTGAPWESLELGEDGKQVRTWWDGWTNGRQVKIKQKSDCAE